ncbi:MAG: virulence RhuM family protein [Candidatus Nomurabacteria bacterium]|nr:virulence RhuM family protein [Candidatus Nomurabacteria bacterium]
MKDNSNLPHIHIQDQPKLVKEGVFIIDNEVWSTQKRIARIYGRSVPTINDHLKKMYREKELIKSMTERALMVTQKEGKKEVARKTYVYNTDIVIAVGFRVKGEWGKEFRIWAREVVRESYDPLEQIKHLIVRRFKS